MLGAQGPVCIVEFPDLAQRPCVPPHEAVLANIRSRCGPYVRRTTLLKTSAPSTMNSRQTSGIEPALDEMVDQRLHYGGRSPRLSAPLRMP
jgi:hypothetical protein